MQSRKLNKSEISTSCIIQVVVLFFSLLWLVAVFKVFVSNESEFLDANFSLEVIKQAVSIIFILFLL